MRQLVPASVAALLLVSCSNGENAKNQPAPNPRVT